MKTTQGLNYNYDKEISNEEYAVINKFLALYRNQSIIVADSFRQDFGMVPLEDKRVIFKTNEDTWKVIEFCRKIYHKGKPYIVELVLWRVGSKENDPKCLSIHEFRIVTKEQAHFIDLNIEDAIKKNILFNIISIFDERKIISPEQAYCKQMYTDKVLQEFMINHEWARIAEGLRQAPSLANALFVIREGFITDSRFTADFGTILYQLILFRQNHQNDFYDKDLLELDKLILNLSNTELLKVQLFEQMGGCKTWPTASILLESNNSNGRVHISEQYNVGNGELAEENRVLNKCIRILKRQMKL